MKTRSKVVLFLLALVACIAFAPQLLRLDRVQTAIIVRLQKDLPFEMRLDALRWHWWPLPYFAINDLQMKSDHWQLTAPTAEFHPAWTAILNPKGRAGRIVLKQPAGRVEKASGEEPPENRPAPRLPHLALIVEDGSLSIPAGVLPFPVTAERLHLAGITGRIDLGPEEVAVRASATSPLFKNMALRGNFHPATADYHVQVESRGLELHKAIASLAGGRLVPGESVVDLKGEIEGTGLARLKADLIGEFPCFLVRSPEQSLLITCGLADLSLVKSGDDFELTIKDLTLKEPGLTLQGNIRRQAKTTADPWWEIDLTARNIDISEIREKVLTLLGDDHTVQVVTGVVRSGRAPELRFSFSGPAADLKHLEALTIEGQLETTQLQVPEVELQLEDVSGAFAIREAQLTGSNLQARLGTSEGRNGELLLALTGDRKEFLLDLDLEAEIAELPGVLHQVVRDEAFLREVDLFSDLEGRVNGHLHLGDLLRHLVVKVTVDDAKATGRYGRLSWPFQIEGGRLEVVSDRRVGWQNVRAALGPHHLAEAAGAVSWQEELRLDVDSFHATLAAAPLFYELNRYPEVRRKLAPVLAAIAGRIEVTQGTFHGPLHRSAAWQYRLGIEGESLAWTSPLLDQPVSTRNLSGSFSHQEAVVAASESDLLGQRLAVQGRFKHRQLAQWHGWVEIDGAVEHRLASWVKEKGWVPPTFFPQVPCIMEKLRIGWGEGYLSLIGGIVAGKHRQALPRVDFDLRKTGEDLVVKRVAITAADEHGLLSLDLPGGRAAPFELSWRGNLDGRTVSTLLANNRLLDGRLSGVCTFRYAPGQPQQTRLVGSLQAIDLRLPLPGPEPLLIERAQVNGDGFSVDVPLLLMQFAGERVEAKGRIATAPEGLDLNFALSSPALSWPTLVRLQESFSDKEGAPVRGALDLRGRIGFDIAEFRAVPATDPGGEEAKTRYSWQPLQGAIELQPGEVWQLGVDHATVCGLDMNGTWSSGEGAGLVRLRSDPQAPPAFEEVMPCLGIEQDLIVGEFSLDATLQGRPGQWTSGEARLESEHGNIRRLTLLSRIFSVVNFTDLFTSDVPDAVAGGLPYSKMDLQARVADNHLVFEKALVRGEGLNLFGRGTLDLSTFRSDFTVLIAPFKTIDAIVTRVPVIGRAIGGKNATLVTIPVGVKGPVSDPSVMVLDPEAVGESLLALVKNTLSLPFTILSPIFSNE